MDVDVDGGVSEHEQLALWYAVSTILMRAATLDEALPLVLRVLCEQGNWDTAAFWHLDPVSGELRCRETWPSPPSRGGVLARLNRQFSFARGVGLPGRACAGGEPVWIADIAGDETFERTLVALKMGLHAACAVPVAVEQTRHGVLEVFSREVRVPDAALVRAPAVVGLHLGHFLERLHAEEERRAGEARLRSVVDQAPVVLFALDREGVITLHEGCGLEMMGQGVGTPVGRSVFEVYRDVPEALPQVRRALAGEAVTATATFAGSVVETRYRPLRATDGQLSGVTGVSLDVTERTRMEEALHHQTLHDALTDLPNRTLLLDRLQQAMRAAHRLRQPLALLLLDLDGFKEINASFGHGAGDAVLQQVARRVQGVLRASDTVARLGGDEFAVVLPGADASCAGAAADRVLRALEQPCAVDGHSLYCGGSIGIAVYPDHGDDMHSLVQHADVAMYDAKRRGGGWAAYDPAQDPYSPSKLLLAGDLRQAIDGDQLVLHYQPLVDIRTRRTASVEALVRWQHPRHGLLMPGQFVPLAEHAGLLRSLSRWVLQEAIRQCSAWQGQGLGVQVVVNLSVQDLYDPGLEPMVARMLEQHGLPPARLAVEITESTIMTRPEHALQAIARLHSLGVRMAIDDFGTGYSSLAYLKHLPVDEIKIDRSFVRDMTADANDAIIVEAVIELGHKLGLQVVAEGVETGAALEVLAGLGCDYAQGYHLSCPLPVSEITTWLAGGKAVRTGDSGPRMA